MAMSTSSVWILAPAAGSVPSVPTLMGWAGCVWWAIVLTGLAAADVVTIAAVIWQQTEPVHPSQEYRPAGRTRPCASGAGEGWPRALARQRAADGRLSRSQAGGEPWR
jgi:hypothetical protein